jgi:hypothetical protein
LAHFYVWWRKNFFQCLCQKIIHSMHSEFLEFEIGYMWKPWIYRKMQSGCKMQTMPSFFKTSTCRVLYELHLTSYIIPFVWFYMMTTASRELLLLLVQWEFQLSHFLREISWAFKKRFLQAIWSCFLVFRYGTNIRNLMQFLWFCMFPIQWIEALVFLFVYLKRLCTT